MSAALTIATSGMNASALRLEASASNVANALTEGPVPQTPPDRPVARSDDPRSVYQAVDVVQVDTGSGTAARMTQRLPAYELRYRPDAPFADARGMVAAPNVDYAREIAEQVASVAAFKANAKVFATASEMARTVIDMKI